MSFSDGFYTTNGSLSVVKQDERKPSFFWSKIVLDAFKPEEKQVLAREEEDAIPHPLPPFLDIMT